jgi:hypothetical protein
MRCPLDNQIAAGWWRIVAIVSTPAISMAAPNRGFSQAEATGTNSPDLAAANSAPVSKGNPVEKSVVKIFATFRSPDFFRPCNKLAPTSVVGSGVVMEGKRILSNAHVLLYATEIQIQANDGGDKINATLESISPDADLAVLTVEDPAFFDNHLPLARSSQLPEARDAVTVYGFPLGGTGLSITKGIVSRIEYARYNYNAAGLRIQVDAAINPGNSGGPAVVGDKMVGLAFAHIYGPLVFTEASADMLQSIVMRRSGLLWLLKMEDQASPLITRPNDPPNFPGERLVMVSAVLQDKIMRGYNDPTVEVIKTLNGTPVKNLGHLVQLLRDSTNQFDNFELYGHETTTDSMVFSH